MSKEKTISDFIAKDNKKLSFEERSRKFEQALAVLSQEWGVAPWAQLVSTKEALVSVPVMKDLWDSGAGSSESGT